MRLYTALVVVFLFSITIAQADDNENSRSSLRGLKGVHVVVEHLPPEVEQNGLTASAIQTDVELKLRQAGVPVLELNQPPFDEVFLSILLQFIPAGDGLWPYTIKVEVFQAVTLKRDLSIVVDSAVTWSVGDFGSARKLGLRNLRDNVKDRVDQFINAYLAANPKK